MLTQEQIKSFVDVGSLPNTAADFLRFVTEFFDVIRQSGPHIYHSALQLTPQSSVVWKLYSHQIRSPMLKVVNGIPTSWDSYTAGAGAEHEILHATWSPCGRFIAASLQGAIQIQDSNTLERLSVYNPPSPLDTVYFEFLAFSPDGRLLASVHKSRYIYLSLVIFPVSASTLTSVPRNWLVSVHVVDVQTGVTIVRISISESGEPVFSRNCRTFALLESSGTFSMYDGVNGTYICGGKLPVSSRFPSGAYWAHGESFQFFTASESNGKLMVNIREFRPTLTPQFHVVESFTVSPHDGKISFSHVSLHASFTTETGVVILDLRDSRTLLQAGAAHSPYTPPGHFSPDGCFFACGTQEGEIYIWKFSSTNYVPWSTLRPWLSFSGFSFSPTTSSILAWGGDGVQLLEPGNHPVVPSPDKLERRQQGGNHLVAYSADGMHIATVRRGDGVVTVLGTLSNTPRRSFDTNMRILDIKTVGDAIFVADGRKLVGWDLETGEPVYNSKTAAISASAPDPYLVLSDDCSQIAFADNRTLFSCHEKEISLYNVQTQRILCSGTAWDRVKDIRFSPDGSQLWLASCVEDGDIDLVKLERMEDGEFIVVRRVFLGGKRSDSELLWANLFSPHAWHCRGKFEWVEDSGGNKLLWLPLSWRVKESRDMRWDDNFLAFVGSDHPDPIVIEFQTQPASFLSSMITSDPFPITFTVRPFYQASLDPQS